MFEREDWKLFRNIETLCQKAGVHKESISMLVIKELVDNALDTDTKCSFGILSGNGFYVEDQGIGINPNLLSSYFSINRPMITTKLLRLPTRGALGNGLRVVVGSVIASNGKIFVYTKGNKYEILLQNDGTSIVNKIEEYSKSGTRIEIYFGNSLRVDDNDLSWSKLAQSFNKGEKFNCKTSAYWYTSESFFELIDAFTGDVYNLCLYFEGINKLKAKSISEVFNNCQTRKLSFEQSEQLLNLIRQNSKSIKHKKLGLCGDLNGKYGEYAKKIGVFKQKSFKGKCHAEIPFVVESWTKFQETEAIYVLVNKTPITGEVKTWMSKGELCISGCGLSHGFKSKTAQIVFNVVTPYMPITSDGKAPNLREFYHEIKSVISLANKKAKKVYVATHNFNASNEREIVLNNLEEAIDKASGDRKYKFSQRQLYYAIRPYVMNALDKQPEYNYFCRLLTEYENENGDIEGLYRDPRGTLYHPHLKQEIPLGTIAVSEYERPEWTFNKIIYSEKEGFFTILKDAKFPERYDCALLTSKGYASRAVKDLFDLLGDTDEEIQFFCIHDADAAGTKIYETLQEATLSRAARRIKVINIGLESWEAEDMGLEVESFNKKGRKPVAEYVRDYDYDNNTDWREWLQNNRTELNAMTTPQFLQWLESKMDEHGIGKVIPDTFTLSEKLSENVKNIIQEKIKNDILENAGYDELVRQAVREKHEEIRNETSNLRNRVDSALQDELENHWTEPIKEIAKEIVYK
jgi:hypothetical protein